ncbi:MAG: ABC transporter substrate binding protein [Verrucomicrobiota bacterium]|nr:ABC transporter substrate binding protein [Verrucomicrobiota bacterium]
MKNTIRFLTVSLLAISALASSEAQELKGKKILYINSYHAGYTWSDGIEQSIQSVLKPTGAEIKTFSLDTYRQKTPEHLTSASAECQATIDQWKPDVVIISDDAGMKGVYAPLFKDKDVPFVFCGVNWDAANYGVPNKNITGMLEVCPVKDLLAEMNKIKPGKTIGYLSADALTPRKDAENCAKLLGVSMETVFAKNFAEWKQGFTDLQGKVDFVIIGVNAGIADWDEAAARKFAEENTKKLTGCWHDYLNGVAIIGFNKLAAEQGDWAAHAAIKIAKGAAASSIPIATNQGGELVINVRIATKAGITPPFEMLQSAKIIE